MKIEHQIYFSSKYLPFFSLCDDHQIDFVSFVFFQSLCFSLTFFFQFFSIVNFSFRKHIPLFHFSLCKTIKISHFSIKLFWSSLSKRLFFFQNFLDHHLFLPTSVHVLSYLSCVFLLTNKGKVFESLFFSRSLYTSIYLYHQD